MAKPIFIATFRNGIPSREIQINIKKNFEKIGIYKDYYVLISFEDYSDKGNTFELLTRGRNTKTLTKKIEKLLNKWQSIST